jgi:cold shock CspA family protein
MRRGSVTLFDEARGLGGVTDETGDVFTFHCVEITDGTRSIAVGTPVRFEVIAKLGHYEAARITTRNSDQ